MFSPCIYTFFSKKGSKENMHIMNIFIKIKFLKKINDSYIINQIFVLKYHI